MFLLLLLFDEFMSVINEFINDHKVVDTQLDRKLNVQARLSLSGLNGKIF